MWEYNYSYEYLYHHGILGMKWGVKNGPPYPLSGNSHNASERKAGWRKSLGGGRNEHLYERHDDKRKSTIRSLTDNEKRALKIGAAVLVSSAIIGTGVYLYRSGKGRELVEKGKETIIKYKNARFNQSEYAKKYVDQVIKEGTTVQTLSGRADRLEKENYFYATHIKNDSHQYKGLFSRNAKDADNPYKMSLESVVKRDIKVGSEDKGIKAMQKLINDDDRFKKFIFDKEGMRSVFEESKYKHKDYRLAKKILERVDKDPNYKLTTKDTEKVYRMFNYVIPSNSAKDSNNVFIHSPQKRYEIVRNRSLFFNELKTNGYGAILDSNDSISGAFKATSPVIVFDQKNIALGDIKDLSAADERVGMLVVIGRRLLGV